jgi:hypothetical protein
MKSLKSQIHGSSTATICLRDIVVSGDSGIEIGIANTLSDAEKIAFFDESRSSFLSRCGFHGRSADKEAFCDFIDICKSELEQVHI